MPFQDLFEKTQFPPISQSPPGYSLPLRQNNFQPLTLDTAKVVMCTFFLILSYPKNKKSNNLGMKLQVKGSFKSHSFSLKKAEWLLHEIFFCAAVTLIPYFKISLCSSASSFSKYFSNPRSELTKLQVKMVSFTTLLVLQDQGQRYIFL